MTEVSGVADDIEKSRGSEEPGEPDRDSTRVNRTHTLTPVRKDVLAALNFVRLCNESLPPDSKEALAHAKLTRLGILHCLQGQSDQRKILKGLDNAIGEYMNRGACSLKHFSLINRVLVDDRLKRPREA